MQGIQLELDFTANAAETLAAEVEKHQNLYQAGKPVISDAEYDALTRKLEAVKPDSKALARIGIADGKVKPICEVLRFVAYDAVDALDEAAKFANLGALGFEVAKHTLVSWNAVERTLEAFTDARAAYAYDCDGIVLKLAKKAHQIALGCTRHHPRAAIALKFDSEGF